MGLLTPLILILTIPIAGAIILLYLLKLKRKEKVVSSVLLWQQAIQDVQANAPFQKLKKNLLLFIQIGVVLLAVAALARPFAQVAGLAGQNIVIIIDSSASMNATDIGKSRFDEAKKTALATVDRMGKGDNILVIAAGAKTKVASSFTSDRKSLASAISSLQACDTRANLREAMILALSLVTKKKHPQIVVISDGGFTAVSDINPGPAKINFIKVGKRSDNIGIVAMDSRRTLSGDRQVFVGLRSFSDRRRDFNMEVYLDDKLIDVRNISLDKGASKQEILGGWTEVGGRLTIKLDLKDDLAADNIGHVYLSAPRRLSVLLATKGNLFLERAFNLDPRTEVVKVSEVPKDISGYDIAIFDGLTPPDNLPKGGYLLVNTSCKAAPAGLSKELANPNVADWSRSHPVTSYVDMSGLRLQSAKSLSLRNWASELIVCEGGTIAAAGENNGRRVVVLGWDLLKSDFPLRVGFPIFITNCIEWLAGSSSDMEGIAVRTGEIAPLDPKGEAKITVTRPDGSSKTITTNSGTVSYDETELVGVYEAKIGKKTYEFSANLLSADESNTAPRGEIKLGERQVSRSAGGIKTNREFWRIILLLGLALLSFEWYAFHRRLG